MKIVYLFWHEECPRCRDFKPVWDAWAQKYSGADFVSVPLDDPYVARKLNISRIPTVVVVDGESILGWFGYRLPTEEEIVRLLGFGSKVGATAHQAQGDCREDQLP